MLGEDILALWPEAPLADGQRGERWLRFEGPGGPVYLERYAWDEETRPHFLVVDVKDGSSAQRTFVELADAVAAVRACIAGPGQGRAGMRRPRRSVSPVTGPGSPGR